MIAPVDMMVLRADIWRKLEPCIGDRRRFVMIRHMKRVSRNVIGKTAEPN